MIPLIATALGLAALSDTESEDKEAVRVYVFEDGVSVWRLIADGYRLAELRQKIQEAPTSSHAEWVFKTQAIGVLSENRPPRGAVFFLRTTDMKILPVGLIVRDVDGHKVSDVYPDADHRQSWAWYFERFYREIEPWVDRNQAKVHPAKAGKWLVTNPLLEELGEPPVAINPDMEWFKAYAGR